MKAGKTHRRATELAKRIEIVIDSAGVVVTETSGFSGGECLEATKQFEDMLGPVVGSRELKSEFYTTQSQAQVEIQTDGGGK